MVNVNDYYKQVAAEKGRKEMVTSPESKKSNFMGTTPLKELSEKDLLEKYSQINEQIKKIDNNPQAENLGKRKILINRLSAIREEFLAREPEKMERI